MKVLFVIDSLGHGGAERSLVEMIPALRAAGLETVIVPLDDRPGPLTRDAQRAGASVVQLRGRSLLPRMFELRRIIKRERPTIVHTTLFISDQIGRLAAFGTGTRVISSLVNTIYDPVRLLDPNVRRHRLALVRLIDGWTARHLTVHLHAISSAVKESCSRALRVAPDRITVVERGRDPARLGAPSRERRLRARAALGISEDAQVVLTVGRQEFQKGQEYLVAAFDRLAGSHPRAVLLLAGRTGHATPVLEAGCARSEHRDRIHLLGQRDDVPELLAAADVFAFPSRYEGFGGALVEAMALAVPAVVSDIRALREVVAGTGAILVPPGDPKALAAGLARILDDPAWAAELGARARSMFVERLTTAHSSARMLALYARIAGQRVPASSDARPALRGAEDRDFCIRLLQSTELAFSTEPLSRVSKTGSRLSQQNMGPIYAYLLEKYHDDIAADRRVHADWQYRIARAYARAGQMPEARRALRRSVRLNPARSRRWLLWLASFGGDGAYGTASRMQVRLAEKSQQARRHRALSRKRAT